MIVLIGIAYLAAGNFVMNGFLHLLMGLRGKKFVRRPKTVSQKQYEKIYKGRLFFSGVFNAVFGLAQLYAVIFALVFVGSFEFRFSFETGMLLVGIAAGVIFLSWKYEGTIS